MESGFQLYKIHDTLSVNCSYNTIQADFFFLFPMQCNFAKVIYPNKWKIITKATQKICLLVPLFESGIQ